jgi:hypothetical protein
MGDWRLILIGAVSFGLVFGRVGGAGADVQVSGSHDRLVVQVKQASLSEILSAMESAIHIKIDLTGSNIRRFTGTYSGSIRRVLSRLLDATDYVIEPAGDSLHVRIVSVAEARSARAVASAEVAALTDLATAAARDEGSRAARIRQQRAIMQPAAGRDQE